MPAIRSLKMNAAQQSQAASESTQLDSPCGPSVGSVVGLISKTALKQDQCAVRLRKLDRSCHDLVRSPL